MDIERLIGTARLPSPSHVVLTLYDALENDGAEEIGRIIGSDPGLTARLLRLANSAFYGVSTVGTVREAIVKVGTTELVGLVFSTEVMRIFYSVPEGRFGMQAFWEHSLRTACLSRVLSSFGKVSYLAPLWVGGLLHDIGRLFLVRHAPIEYADVLDHIDKGVPSLEAEQELFGFTHAQAGGQLLQAWGLPELFATCAAHHHDPFTALETPQSIVAAANRLAHRELGDPDLPGLPEAERERVQLAAGQLYERYRQLFAEYLR